MQFNCNVRLEQKDNGYWFCAIRTQGELTPWEQFGTFPTWQDMIAWLDSRLQLVTLV